MRFVVPGTLERGGSQHFTLALLLCSCQMVVLKVGVGVQIGIE